LLATTTNARVRDGNVALKTAEEGLKSQANSVALLDAKAAALAELGRFDEAIETANEALGFLGKSQNELSLRRAIESRIRMYKSGKPFRDR